MSDMKAYVLSVAGAVLISAVLMIVAPSGKMGKFVKGMAKLFVMFVLILPFSSALKGELSTGKIEENGDFLLYCEDAMQTADAREISSLLQEEFGIITEVTTERSAGELMPEHICVKILDFGIIGGEGHIDIVNRVQAYLSERYGCGVEVA